jgi:hypothetical protein
LEQVVLNGAVLVRGHDYTATTGTTITGLSPALVASDVLEVFSFIAFTVANTYTQSQVDGLIAPYSGVLTGWTSFTPVMKQGATTLTATIAYARYKQIGKTVFLQVNATITNTGSTNGLISIDFPSGLTPVNNTNEPVWGTMYIRDTGSAYYMGVVTTNGSAFIGRAYGSQDSMGVNTPTFTLVNNDTLSIQVTYEVA